MAVHAAVSALCSAHTTERELDSLRGLSSCLSSSPSCTPTENSDMIEQHFLIQSKSLLEEGNPFPMHDVTELSFSDGYSLSQFIFYVLTRRYGWSEVQMKGDDLCVYRINGFGKSSSNESSLKTSLNELLDEFLKWLGCQALSLDLLRSFKDVLSKASQHPVIRKQTILHILDWFRSKCTVFHETFFPTSKELILIGLTDVWSAIRTSCATKLGSFIEQFNLRQLGDLLTTLVQICKNADSSWQSKEGSVMGLNTIIRKFHYYTTTDDNNTSLSEQLSLKFGKEELHEMPEFISSQIHDVVFTLLSDAQLTIREHATRAYSSYLCRTGIKESMIAFKEVTQRLAEGSHPVHTGSDSSRPTYHWLDAFMADGLLGLSIFLIKHIPSEKLGSDWINIFSVYLMHPASTVRQASSNIFKFLVTKDTSNPTLLKMVLQSLSNDWMINMKLLASNCIENVDHTNAKTNYVLHKCQHRISNPSITTINAALNVDSSNTWQWREGRLLSFELIFQFLIKNHWLYTFGAAYKSTSFSESEFSKGSKESLRLNSPKPPDTLVNGNPLNQSTGSYKDSLEEFDQVSSNTSLSCSTKSPQSSFNRELHTQSSIGALPYRRATVGQITNVPVRSNSRGSDRPRSLRSSGHHTAIPLISFVKTMEQSSATEESSSTLSAQSSNPPLPPMKRILTNILYQTIECIDSTSWELRRMSLQVLPCLVEVIRWYDMSILSEFWSLHLNTETSLLTFGVILSFYYSLTHAAKLATLIDDPPDTWQDVQACKTEVSKIVDSTKSQMIRHVDTFIELCKRPALDKITVVSLQILMTYITIPLVENVSCEVESITTLLTILSLNISWSRGDENQNNIVLTTDCFLSCNSQETDNLSTCIYNLQKYTLEHSHNLLIPFIKYSNVMKSCLLLPHIASCFRKQFSSDHLHRTLADCIILIVEKMQSVTQTHEKAVTGQLIGFCIYELQQSISTNLKGPVLHSILDCLHSISTSSLHKSHLPTILRFILQQVNTNTKKPSSASSTSRGLELFSNDIKTFVESGSNEESETDDEEEKVIQDGDQMESLALQGLNTSTNSGGTTSGRHSSLSQRSTSELSQNSVTGVDDADSDWDSWDEDEKENEDLSSVMSEFLIKIQKSLRETGRLSDLKTAAKELSSSDVSKLKLALNWR